jgi:hypothetical protein
MNFLKISKFPARENLAKNFRHLKFPQNRLKGVFRAQESDSELNFPQKPRPKPTFAYRLSPAPAKIGWHSKSRSRPHPNPIVVWENRLLHPQKQYKISISEPPESPKHPNQTPRNPPYYIY